MYRSNFLLTEQYNDLKIKNYIVCYKYIDYKKSIELGYQNLKDHQNEFLDKKFQFPKTKLALPLSYDIELWDNIYDIKSDNIKLNNWNIIFPEIEDQNENINIITGLYRIKDYVYKITQYKYNTYSTIQVDYHERGIIELEFYLYDKIISSNEFNRKFQDYFYKIKDNKIISREIFYNYKRLNPLKVNLMGSKNIIALDIETLNIQGSLTPYCIGIYDGTKFEYEYGNDNIVEKIFNKLLIKKYNNHVVYAHNLCKFDYIYILDY
jgi:hypothetical protein